MEKNRQGFSPNYDHSLKIEAEQGFARFLLLAAYAAKSGVSFGSLSFLENVQDGLIFLEDIL